MAEHGASGEREQAGRSGSIQPEPKAAAHGISRQRRSTDFQQPGRKCHPALYAGTKELAVLRYAEGAETSAIVYSLVESARANGIEHFGYLQHVLLQLPYLGKSYSHQEVESLMPWAPYIQQNFKMPNSNAYANTYLD